MKIRSKKDLRAAMEDVRHLYPQQAIRLEIYRLACIFYSSKRLRDLSDGSDWCPYQPLRDDFEGSEIARILLVLASAGRQICSDLRAQGYAEAVSKNIVGIIQENVAISTTKPLNVLEACSKILHAALILPKVRYQGNPFRQYLRPEVTMYSTQHRAEGWRAVIKIDEFVAAFSNIS